MLCIFSYILNDFYSEETFNLIKTRALELDKQYEAEEHLRKIYRPDNLDLTESSEKEMRTVTGPNEHYEKGSEVYMSYGRNSNRQLLSVYGFSLKINHFNFAVFKTQIKNLVPPEFNCDKLNINEFTPDHYTKFKFKEKLFCNKFVATLRRLRWKKNHPIEAFFTANLLELEVEVLNFAIKLLNDYLNTYPTSYEEDVKLMNTEIPLRKYFAVLYRSQVKEIFLSQIQYLNSARNIVTAALTNGISNAIKDELASSSNPEKIEFALKQYLEEFKP